jgi:membrane protein implicated in regulation of membrane protease activity
LDFLCIKTSGAGIFMQGCFASLLFWCWGVLLPFLGISLVAVLLVERWVLRYIPAAKNFLGLN